MSETFVDTMGGGGVKYVVTSFMGDNLPRFEVLDQFVIGDTATIGQHELANGLLRELGWSACHLVIENLNEKICFFKMFFFLMLMMNTTSDTLYANKLNPLSENVKI